MSLNMYEGQCYKNAAYAVPPESNQHLSTSPTVPHYDVSLFLLYSNIKFKCIRMRFFFPGYFSAQESLYRNVIKIMYLDVIRMI